MQPANPAVAQFIRGHLGKHTRKETENGKRTVAQAPVITLSMEPGSLGCQVAQTIAGRLGFNLYNRDIIIKIARSMKTSATRIDAMEKERLSGIEDFIASLIEERYLHNDTYLEHLIKVVGVIADHGKAVIVGRGANFILPVEKRFAVRIIAPSEIRIANIARAFKVAPEMARKRISRREARRRAFVRFSFNKEIRNPRHYDMTLNTARMNVEAAAEAIIAFATAPQETRVGAGKV